MDRDPIAARLRVIAELNHGWDGPGSMAPSTQTLEHAGRVARALEPLAGTVSLFPIPDGGMQIECEDTGYVHEIEISPNGNMFFISHERA